MMSRSLLMSMIVYSFGPLLVVDAQSVKVTRTQAQHAEPRIISFDSNDGAIDINLDLSVPFLKIPFSNKVSPVFPSSLLHLNTRALAIGGMLVALSVLIIPLMTKKQALAGGGIGGGPSTSGYYRSERSFDVWQLGESVNEILFRNKNVTPCVQRVICYAVATSNNSQNPSSADKIIDGLSGLGWFESASNGTTIKDAVKLGRKAVGPEDCAIAYKGCFISPKMVANILNIVGIH